MAGPVTDTLQVAKEGIGMLSSTDPTRDRLEDSNKIVDQGEILKGNDKGRFAARTRTEAAIEGLEKSVEKLYEISPELGKEVYKLFAQYANFSRQKQTEQKFNLGQVEQDLLKKYGADAFDFARNLEQSRIDKVQSGVASAYSTVGWVGVLMNAIGTVGGYPEIAKMGQQLETMSNGYMASVPDYVRNAEKHLPDKINVAGVRMDPNHQLTAQGEITQGLDSTKKSLDGVIGAVNVQTRDVVDGQQALGEQFAANARGENGLIASGGSLPPANRTTGSRMDTVLNSHLKPDHPGSERTTPHVDRKAIVLSNIPAAPQPRRP